MLVETEDSFLYNYVSKFNSLEKRGKDKILPLLIKCCLETKPEGGWHLGCFCDCCCASEPQRSDQHNGKKPISDKVLKSKYAFVIRT
jgi:hypothetical protein